MSSTTSSVFGADDQREVPIDVARWVGLVELVLEAEQVPTGTEVSLLFVEEQTVAELNEHFLGRTGPTDVLAFPIDDDVVPGGRRPDEGGRGPGVPSGPSGPPTLLGDVVVCPAVAVRQAAERGRPLDEEVALLVVHGTLHLLNYDHAEPAESTAMRRREQELLGRFRAREEGS